MKKRATALLLILLMVVSMMPVLGANVLAAETRFEEATSLISDGEYILGAVKDDGTVYALKSTGSNNSDVTSATLTVTVANGSNPAYVETSDTGVVWTYTSSKYFQNGTLYFYPTSSRGVLTYNSGRAMNYNDGKLSFSSSSSGDYYIVCNNGVFSTSQNEADATAFRVFKKVASDPTPVDPPVGNTIDITPAAGSSAPSESISIDVGEAFTLNVQNAGRNSYSFTATASKSNIVEIQPPSVDIASGSTGTFTVTGLTDGTVDITISNNNTSSERKGIIHVTVGDGGSTPVDPPAGDIISVTPDATNIPQESITIDVNDVFTIKVTNSSSRSGYDFAATASKSGVVEVQPSSVNIAAGSTGTFTVTGLTDGTVDITISNNNSNSERKAIIHVTVGTGGSEEPPTPVTETLYVEVTSLTADGEYILGAVKDEGNVYAIKKGSSSVSSVTLPVTAASGGNPAYIETTDEGVAWKYTADGYFTNGSSNPYMYPSSSNGIMTYSSGRAISFIEGKLSFETSNDGTFYITCNEGTFSTSNVAANAASFRLFMKTDEIPGPISVTGVTLDKETMALTVGGTGTLTATVAPGDAANKNVTWNSSDETVATVNDGTVTALKAGTAVITVKTVDGEWTATCTVTVTAPQEIESSVIELAKLKNSSVWLIQVEEEEDKGFTYKGDAMVWSSRYEAYVIAVESATEPTLAAADFATAGDAAAAVEYPAANDANGSKKVDMADVQYIYNLYSGKYETLEAAGDMTKVLGADINGDGVIDSKDATPILTALRGAQA